MRVLSLCTSAGLWDKAFLEAGFLVDPSCEIVDYKRDMYRQFCSNELHMVMAIQHVPYHLRHGMGGVKPSYDGIIGGIPCQSRSRTRAMRPPKFGDLLPHVLKVLDSCLWQWAIFENVAPLDIPGFRHVQLDAMNFGQPHQSRPRWFTYCGLNPPKPIYPGTVDSLLAYPSVAGRLYGPKRGAILQGWPSFASLPFPCSQLQEALADGVPRCLADAWIRMVPRSEWIGDVG